MVQIMSARRTGLLIILGITLSVAVSACAGSVALGGETIGCRQDIRGVKGIIRPETSKLRCDAINEIIFGMPSEPQAYSIFGDSPHLLWQCRLYPVKGHSVLLRCSNKEKHFSVVKETGLPLGVKVR